MTKPTIRVAIDVGSKSHRVGVGLSEGQVLEGFSIAHNQKGFEYFFGRVELHRQRLERPVEVAMEGYNGWARPLDQQIQQRGYKLLNVNNLKLARFKEIFPAPAKTDQIDTDKMLELFQLGDTLKRAKNVIQEVKPVPAENQQLKRLTRRRRQLVDEKVSLGNRLLADLQAICPELSALTGSVDNRWFLNFLTARKDLRQLSRLRRHSVLQIKRIGSFYADIIQSWQKEAHFSAEVEWVGEMIHHDARRMLELLEQIAQLNNAIEDLTQRSANGSEDQKYPWLRNHFQRRVGRRDRHTGALRRRGEPGHVPGDGHFGQLLLPDGGSSTHPSCEPANSPGHDGGCGPAPARGSPVTDLLLQEESRRQKIQPSYPIPGPSSGSSVMENAHRGPRLRDPLMKKRLTILPGCSS